MEIGKIRSTSRALRLLLMLFVLLGGLTASVDFAAEMLADDIATGRSVYHPLKLDVLERSKKGQVTIGLLRFEYLATWRVPDNEHFRSHVFVTWTPVSFLRITCAEAAYNIRQFDDVRTGGDDV